jgi:hypothetical protein
MFIRVLSSIVFLFLIVLFVPLAFDVGGRDAGLAYSLALVTFYLGLSILRVSTPDRSRFRWSIVQILRSAQWIIVPALLIWALGRFSVDVDNSTGSWVERTFKVTKDAGTETNTTAWNKIFGSGGLFDSTLLRIWDKLLQVSSPFFQLCEGFCSLLVIQATGQLTRWLVNRSERSDAWMLTIIVAAAGISSSSVYFLWRVLQFPDVSTLDATLIGITIAGAIFLCAYGVTSGRGTAAESSLLFAYIALCLYQIFTDYKPNAPAAEAAATRIEPDFPPFPPIIMSSYHSLLQALTMMPDFAVTSLSFISAAFAAVTPSVIISLGYRLFVFYASTRIIPAINESGAQGLSLEPELEDSNAGNKFLTFLSWFSPSILISVYTSLLMQHFATTMGGYSPGLTGTIGAWWNGNGQPGMDGNLWKWVNLVGTMALYAVELSITKDEDLDGRHWKVD